MRALARIAAASTIAAALIGTTLVPAATAATTNVSAEADSWVLSSSPRANKGTVNPLRVRAGVRIAYLRFRVPAFDASTTITSATLRLFSTSASRCTMQVLRAGNDSWGETSINWNNQPGVVGSVLASASWTGQAYRSFVVTPVVTKGAAVSFAVRHVPGCTTSSDATFSSREASTNRPQLVVETNVTAPPAACADGIDNDGDSLVDLADPGCAGPTDDDEFNAPPPPPAACDDGQDNDGDTLVDLADPGCTGPTDDDEFNAPPPPPAACDDGQDNDGDTLVDLLDPGCADATDDDETDLPPPPPAQCADGQDNDGDTLIDVADPGCTGPSDDDEFNPPPPPPAACDDGQDNDGDTKVDLLDPGCADATDDDETDPPPPPPPAACDDGQDNDGDTKVDLLDPGCADATDDDETDPPPPPPPAACDDGQDNDGDTLVDLADPGCTGPSDDDEFNAPPPPPAACADGQDNDGDTKVDLADPGCSGATDDDETDPPAAPPVACLDGLDNDGDGKTDLGADPGCAGVMDNDETDPPPPACNDGLDNDGDTLTDLADPGCTGPADRVEVDVASQRGAPGAIFTCQATGQIGNIDPIVSPGAPSAHPHAFYGARDLTTTETTASLRTKPTSCLVAANHSGLWLPEVREDGVPLLPGQTSAGGGKHMLIYYRCMFNAATCANIVGFADDTRFVMGNSRASSPAENPELGDDVIFKCGPGSGTDLPYPPAQCSSGVLVISFRSDPCIALGATDSSDHRAHLVDPVHGVCPNGYEPTIRVEQFFRFWVGTDPIGMITLGGYPWWTAHSDYLFGWTRPAFENFMTTCVNANRDCGTNPSV